MKIGPKYKIARSLGAPVFEKTQTQKFALAESRKMQKGRKRRKQITDYGIRLKEKQKGRYSYALSEKVFSRTVREAMKQKKKSTSDALLESLESRLDSVVTRAGFGPTRFFCRQLISHGHILVNDRKIDVPSYKVKKGDVIKVKPSSMQKGLFKKEDEEAPSPSDVSWLKVDQKQKIITVTGTPVKDEVDLFFDVDMVLEFYSR
ncbi:MAG: 30S ribosomal protein S4 [Candidatus Paceibacterota bacterium]